MQSSDGGVTSPRSGPRATYPEEQSPHTRRRWYIGLSVLVVAAGLGLAVLGYQKFADPPVSGQVTGYQILSPSRVAVQFTVTRSDPGQSVACVVRGRSADGGETGRREILIPPASESQVGVRTEVTTSRAPVIGEVFGCTADVPAYLTATDES
ncbi:DUF4307 domain-containing protein [Gordonia soli]|uniref:DUF4307 domain-containing protein n=1 Tax=Gordonia soli NBRC 108243 TaxID=1223545 RepID=M0QQD7_9ACTN|nr:DUF4307 domain-containing protein [Gordonia soli]GAC70456.1 hypothetical protein GS4_35_00320 [Gordonia soli NBRC 108243]